MRILSTMFAAALLTAAVTATGAVAETYSFNAGHTEVRFYYDHAGVAEQSGEWGKVTGTVNFDPDNIEATTVSVTVDAASVNTGFVPLDDHLKSADFFEVEKYRQITFTSTGVSDFNMRKTLLFTRAYTAMSDRSLQISVKLWFASVCRILEIRSISEL